MPHSFLGKILIIPICAASIVMATQTIAAPPKPGNIDEKASPLKKAPLDTGKIESKQSGDLQAAEIEIRGVSPAINRPTDYPEPLPNDDFTVKVYVTNYGERQARFALAHLGPAGKLILHGRTYTLEPRANLIDDLVIRLDSQLLRGGQYSGSIVLVKSDARAGDAMRDQLWKDGNNDDNAKNFTVPVDVRKYTVEADFVSVFVSDDCDSGDEPGEWVGRFDILLSSRPLTNTNDLESRSLVKDKDLIYIWGTSGGDTNDLRSRQTYRYGDRRVRLEHVHWNAHVTLAMHASENDSPLASGCWHKPFESLGPDRWLQRRGEWVEFPLTNNNSNLRPTVRIRARPEG